MEIDYNHRTTVVARLNDEDLAKLDRLCRKEHSNRAAIIRRALRMMDVLDTLQEGNRNLTLAIVSRDRGEVRKELILL